MKIAVLYTGALRTIRDVLPHLKKNVIEAATAKGHSVDIFAVLQSNDLKHYCEPNLPAPPNAPSVVEDSKIPETWLTDELSGHLQNLTWFRPNDTLWVQLREHLLSNMTLPDYRASYLRTSGSMIEYYQMQMAYTNLLKHERSHNMTYDYVIRLRPDVVITHPLTFSWLTWSQDDIQDRFLAIQKVTGTAEMYCAPNFLRFMNTLLRPTVDGILDKEMYSLPADNPDTFNWKSDHIVETLQKYLQQGPYIVGLRGNVIYMLPRRFMGLLAVLGSTYGFYNNPNTNSYWWDAETQFQSICLQQRLTVFDSCTLIEAQSLYQYDPARYYHEDGTLKSDPQCVFFLKRH